MEIEQSKADLAEQLFRSGYNCSQSVIGVFCDELNMDFDTAMKISEGFGGGMSRMRLICGAVSAMAMAVGMKFSRGGGEGNTRSVVYGKVQELAEMFREKNGSVICAELLGTDKKNQSPVPEERTEKYYKKRPCIGCIRDGVEILEKNLFK